MTTLPLTLAMIALSQIQTTANNSADLNNDGEVNTADLLLLTSNVGTACDGDCPTDINNDGVTNSADLLILMQQWGSVSISTEGEAGNNTSEETEEEETHDHGNTTWNTNGPVLLDAVYYDQLARSAARIALGEDLNEGEMTKTWCAENNVAVQPMIYNGGVDWYEDGEYDDNDKAKFSAWIDANIPADYDGPICMDMEGQWWDMWHTESQEVMDTVIDFYIEGLEYAQALRPNAKIGYWGLPRRKHTSPNSTTASVVRLLEASTGLFPDVYEWNPGHDDSAWIERHVRNTIEMVQGQVPVFVQASPRYRSNGGAMVLHTIEEYLHDQVHGSLAAVWIDQNGNEHRIAGIAMWDAYFYSWQSTPLWSQLNNTERKAIFNELDEYHRTALEAMKACIDAVTGVAQAEAEAEAAAQAAAAEAARLAAAEAAAAELRAERKRQRSRLVRRLNSERTKIRRASSSYRKSAKQYKTARRSITKNRRSFISSRNAYKSALKSWRIKGRKLSSTARKAALKKLVSTRNSYRKSVRSWRTNVKSWRVSTRSFSKQRRSYLTSRNTWRSTVKTWRTANKTWSQMASVASTLTAQ